MKFRKKLRAFCCCCCDVKKKKIERDISVYVAKNGKTQYSLIAVGKIFKIMYQ